MCAPYLEKSSKLVNPFYFLSIFLTIDRVTSRAAESPTMASKFNSIIQQIIANTPSGEIKDVYQDLKVITGGKANDAILDAIAQYNVENRIPIDVNGKSVVISEYNKEGSKFFDPANSLLFSVDHLDRSGLDVENYEQTLDSKQKTIHGDLKDYTSNNFPGDVTFAVYPTKEENKTAIIIVSQKYNPGNFWNGRWKSEYIYDLDTNTLKGKISVNVHYYEDGNVSFKSDKKVNDENADDVVLAIKNLESSFEQELNVLFVQLNEKKFRGLRRRLPVTRSKINWGKAIGNYRLGKDAAQGKI